MARALRGDEVSRHEHLGGEAQSYDPGQQPGGSHVGAGETDLAEKKRDLGGLGRDAHVTRRGDHGPSTGHGAVQGGYHGAAATADCQNEIAGEPGELE